MQYSKCNTANAIREHSLHLKHEECAGLLDLGNSIIRLELSTNISLIAIPFGETGLPHPGSSSPHSSGLPFLNLGIATAKSLPFFPTA